MTPPPSHPISTVGTTPTVTTTKQSTESTGDWVDRHDKAVEAAAPSGNTLTTTYTSSQGAESVQTTRLENESDAEFRARHQADYLDAMADRPPIP